MSRVLIVEDNPEIAQQVQWHLGDLGIRVDHAGDGSSGLAQARRHAYDLIILDLMAPGHEGRALCRQLRADHCATPILILTARHSEIDRVLCLEAGADDCMTKPFGFLELIAQVKAILRRNPQSSREAITHRPHRFPELGLEINIARREVVVRGNPVELTPKEFDLLWHLARYPGHVFSRAQLLDSIWGNDHAGYEHTINSHINRLRNKIENNPAEPEIVRTVWGVGYKFADRGGANSH